MSRRLGLRPAVRFAPGLGAMAALLVASGVSVAGEAMVDIPSWGEASLSGFGAAGERGRQDEEEGTADEPGEESKGDAGNGPPPRSPKEDLARARRLATQALEAQRNGNLEECIRFDKESLELVEQPITRYHMAICQGNSGKVLDALENLRAILKNRVKRKDDPLVPKAAEAIKKLIPRIAHVTFQPPAQGDDLKVTFDERPVPTESLRKKFSIDPGKHVVRAEGTIHGVPLTFEEEYTVKEGEFLTVVINLQSAQSQYLTPGQLRCMLQAKTPDDVQKCLPQEGTRSVAARLGSEVGGYIDSTAVQVLSPKISGSLTSPTAGWNVGGTYIADVFTAASPDIVSYASPKYREVRHAASLSAGYKPSTFGVQGGGNISREPDYLSLGVNAAVTADFNDKLVTPRLGVSYSRDTIGFKSLDTTYYGRRLDTTEVDLGVTFVLSPSSILALSGTLQIEKGDSSKPYRFVPMFERDIAPRVPAAATIDLVNRVRTNIRANEQLPLDRKRFALGVRYAKRFPISTVRLEERLYSDNWGVNASTTDMRWLVDSGKFLRLWPHFRFHVQSGASFYKLAYGLETDPGSGQLALPLFRTGDRELGPLFTATVGGGLRLLLTQPEAKSQWALTLQGDVMWSRYLKLLFLSTRVAAYGTLGVESEFE